MEEIIKQYGNMLLECLIVGLLFVLIFVNIEDVEGNKGVLQIIGARLYEETADYAAYTDFDVYEEDAYKSAPVIEYSGTSILIGERNLSDYISAFGYAGAELPVKIISVVDRTGRELPVIDEQKVDFDTPGIYIVTVRTVDDTKKATVCTIKIPVNEG